MPYEFCGISVPKYTWYFIMTYLVIVFQILMYFLISSLTNMEYGIWRKGDTYTVVISSGGDQNLIKTSSPAITSNSTYPSGNSSSNFTGTNGSFVNCSISNSTFEDSGSAVDYFGEAFLGYIFWGFILLILAVLVAKCGEGEDTCGDRHCCSVMSYFVCAAVLPVIGFPFVCGVVFILSTLKMLNWIGGSGGARFDEICITNAFCLFGCGISGFQMYYLWKMKKLYRVAPEEEDESE